MITATPDAAMLICSPIGNDHGSDAFGWGPATGDTPSALAPALRCRGISFELRVGGVPYAIRLSSVSMPSSLPSVAVSAILSALCKVTPGEPMHRKPGLAPSLHAAVTAAAGSQMCLYYGGSVKSGTGARSGW